MDVAIGFWGCLCCYKLRKIYALCEKFMCTGLSPVPLPSHFILPPVALVTPVLSPFSWPPLEFSLLLWPPLVPGESALVHVGCPSWRCFPELLSLKCSIYSPSVLLFLLTPAESSLGCLSCHLWQHVYNVQMEVLRYKRFFGCYKVIAVLFICIRYFHLCLIIGYLNLFIYLYFSYSLHLQTPPNSVNLN